MKYFYEYKCKNGAKVGGHNLEDITIYEDMIILTGIDIINTHETHWKQLLIPKDTEYIKITPMEEEYE